ncbi:hypothetical protein H5410_012266 [Solanum commersonii]|uniref:Uncharacterized protein n=1 Tax=Solanum commersonii TaxID=4109 RepID=A0A9J6AQY4_SOLCO|nr:hypothetical protein H5410_012266 [Solanum commersonii]
MLNLLSLDIKEGLELVSQQAYSSEKAPLSPDPRTTTYWDPLSNPQRKGKKLVETPPESDSDLDSNFVGNSMSIALCIICERRLITLQVHYHTTLLIVGLCRGSITLKNSGESQIEA